MFSSDVGESFLFSLPEVFFEDICDLEQLIERDERLETTGLIYRQGSFAEELIMISNLQEEYENRCKIVQLKVLGIESSLKKIQSLMHASFSMFETNCFHNLTQSCVNHHRTKRSSIGSTKTTSREIAQKRASSLNPFSFPNYTYTLEAY